MQKLNNLRLKIDLVDQEILRLLEQRRALVREVFVYKEKKGLSLQDETREQDIVEVLSQKTTQFSRAEIQYIWHTVITSSYNNPS